MGSYRQIRIAGQRERSHGDCRLSEDSPFLVESLVMESDERGHVVAF